MKKQNLLSLLSLLVILIILLAIFSFLEILMEKSKEAIESPFSKLKPAEKFEEGLPSKEFNIVSSGDSYPRFSKASFKPGEVTTGDNQIITVWLEDPTGIKIVKAEIETDLGVTAIDVGLIEGDNKKGAWQGQWRCCGFQKEDYYPVIFTAQSLEGKENSITIFIKNKGYE
jgi:hypothetical protein